MIKKKWYTMFTAHWRMLDPVPTPRSGALPGNSPQFIHWTWCSMVWDIPLASLSHCASCAPSQFLFCSYSLSEHETLNKSLTQDKHNLVKKSYQCVIYTILTLNPKRSTVTAAEQKLTLFQLKPKEKIFLFKGCQNSSMCELHYGRG